MKATIKCILALFIFSYGKVQSQQLVLPGDYPDPSVLKIGNTYWASATTSNWFPAYPLLYSTDLVNWKQKGYVFNELPSWADYYFWAPEISHENGKTYIYYAAHKKGGNLCLGVASADKPEGPYKDHGPLMCQEARSIDAFPMRDTDGKLYMIWKEDGNSVRQPTPIWAMEMNEERTALTGKKFELFRNSEPWEGNLVEGVSMIRHGGYIYAFYAGAGCCGTGCTYAAGVARAKNLLGPWEKFNGNPLLTNTQTWICPGHGTPIEKDGRYYFMYHAYDKSTSVFTGRQGMLIEFEFTPDGWIRFIPSGSGPDVKATHVDDHFNGRSISQEWQWSVAFKNHFRSRKGALELSVLPDGNSSYVGQKVGEGQYTARAKVESKKSKALAGLGAIGDEKNMVAVFYRKGSIEVIQVKDGKDSSLARATNNMKNDIYLRMTVHHGKDIYFFYSYDGLNFTPLNLKAVDGSYLPPWDRAVRAGLISKGTPGQKAVFDSFEIYYE